MNDNPRCPICGRRMNHPNAILMTQEEAKEIWECLFDDQQDHQVIKRKSGLSIPDAETKDIGGRR